MGMYDSFYFLNSASLLPVPKEVKEKLNGVEFQGKAMDCQLDRYDILPAGVVIKNGEPYKGTDNNIEFYYYEKDGSLWQLDADIIMGKLQNILLTAHPQAWNNIVKLFLQK